VICANSVIHFCSDFQEEVEDVVEMEDAVEEDAVEEDLVVEEVEEGKTFNLWLHPNA
jgi:hypothetical protein